MTKRQVGLAGTIAIGLASMLGAGVFVVFRDAYALAGDWLYGALFLAGLVATLNAASIYQLARQVDRPGGTYAYARVYRNDTWSFMAGFAFVFGKIGSIAAIALVFGEYAFPEQKQIVAVIAILVMVVVNVLGIQRTAAVAAVLATVTTSFLILAILLGASFFRMSSTSQVSLGGNLPHVPGWGIVTAASIIFFAFAGYARVATLGNEVRDSKKNIPKAIAITLSAVLAIYLLLTIVLTKVLGVGLAGAEAPFIAFFNELGLHLDWLVLAVASAASLASILALLAGVSRTAAEMSHDRELPRFFAARNRFGSPWVAEVVIAIGASSLVFAGRLSWVIGFSSFSVLFYYAIAHLSALGQPLEERALPRSIAVAGLILCLVLAFSVPGPAVWVSVLILAAALVLRRLFRVDSK